MVISRIHQELTQRFGRSEVHVLGHSFGGLVSLQTHFQNATLPVKSLNVSSPLLGIKVKIPMLKRFAGKALSKIWGSLQMGNKSTPPCFRMIRRLPRRTKMIDWFTTRPRPECSPRCSRRWTTR